MQKKEVLLDGGYLDIVIQGKNGKEERPYMTLVLDKATRYLRGFHISSKPLSKNSVSALLEQFITNK